MMKDRLRAELIAGRAAVAEQVRNIRTRELCRHVSALLTGTETVAAYAPMSTEPGFGCLLPTLEGSCSRILLPVARTARTSTGRSPMPLQWAEYQGTLVQAPFGLTEPGGPTLPPSTLADADVILIPALAVDRRGTRLGRGAGFYDRSLGFRSPTASMIAMIWDDELVDELPADAHDVLVTHVLTPDLGLVQLPPGR